MCCIIHRLKDNKEIAKDNLEKIIKKNPHGWGLSYIDDGGSLKVEKSMNMTTAIDKIRQLESENREFLFHARWATHGEKNTENCHPFPIHTGVMFHNGKFDHKGWRQEMSDSWHFTFKLTKFLKRDISLDNLVNEKYKDVIKESRLAFMLKDGTVVKYGEWHEIDGSFYSKIDWKYVYIPTSTNQWSEIYNRQSRNKSHNGITSNPIRQVKRISVIKDVEYASYEKLAKIDEAVSNGEVTDEDIEALRVNDITALCQNYPETMANYLFEMLHMREN